MSAYNLLRNARVTHLKGPTQQECLGDSEDTVQEKGMPYQYVDDRRTGQLPTPYPIHLFREREREVAPQQG